MTKSIFYRPPKQYNLPDLLLTAKQGKLVGVHWCQQKTLSKIVPTSALKDLTDRAVLEQTISELDEYFLGIRQVFDLPVGLSVGTVFYQAVWQRLSQIPYGKTISYKRLAEEVGRPTAFRAAANANGKNPICIIIPCHRVIASDGGIGGYTGGVWIKKTLLEIESG